MTNPIPHPHADILRAIADGKTEFQRKYTGLYDWEPCDATVILYYIQQEADEPKFRIKPETKTGWINIYSGEPLGTTGIDIWSSKEYADISADQVLTRVACIQITYTPGEGL